MANYYCSARSNYFKVKDRDAFAAWVEGIGQDLEWSTQTPQEERNRRTHLQDLRQKFEAQGGRGVELAEAIDGLEKLIKDEPCCLLAGGEGGGWPSHRRDEESGEYEDFDFLLELADHLQEGEVAILMEAGAEKLRYIIGVANAINHKGEMLQVNLAHIYTLVEETWGITPTRAEY